MRSHYLHNARVVSLVGRGAMGKSTLAKRFAEKNGDIFPAVCWCDFRNAPSVVEALDRAVRLLSAHTPVARSPEASVDQVLELLHSHRALVVLDNLETVMESDAAGQFRATHEILTRLIAQTAREATGALLLTSRDQPTIVSELEGPRDPVKSMRLEGVEPSAAVAIMKHAGLAGKPEELTAIAEHHGRNPYAVRIVAKHIASSDFPGGAGDYIAHGYPLPSELEPLLAEEYERLSEMQRACLLRAAANRTGVTNASLVADLAFRYRREQVQRAIRALRSRGLVEEAGDSFDLQNVLREYCTGRLVDAALEEVKAGSFVVLRDVALITPTGPEYLRTAQWRVMVTEIAVELDHRLGAKLPAKVTTLLDRMREHEQSDVGYAAGALVNILVAAGAKLNGTDLSRLPLWRVQLEGVELHDVRAMYSDFSGARFSRTFGEVVAAAFSDDGAALGVGTAEGSLRVWETDNWREGSLAAHEGHIRAIVFMDGGGSRVATGGSDGAVRCWDTMQRELALEVRPPGAAEVTALAWDQSGGRLLIGRGDGTLAVWDSRYSGLCTDIGSPHQSRIRSMAFLGDGRLLSSDEDGLLAVTAWDEAGVAATLPVANKPFGIVWLTVSPDGSHVAVLGKKDGEIEIVSVDALADDGKRLPAIGTAAWCCCYSLGGETLLVSTSRGSLIRYDLETGSITAERAHEGWARALARDPRGTLLATGGTDRTMRIWRLPSFEVEHVFRGYTRSLWAVAFSEDGNWLAAGGSDGSIHLWDAANRYRGRREVPGGYWIRALAFSPNGPALAVGHDGGLGVLSVNDRQWSDVSDDMSTIWDVCFSRDGRMIAAAAEDCTVRTWEERPLSSEQLGTWQHSVRRTARRHQHWVVSVAFAPEGNALASGDADGVLLVGPPNAGLADSSGEQLLMLSAEGSDQVWGLSYLRNAAELITAGRDRSFRLWDIDAQPPKLQAWPLERSIWRLATTDDGATVFAVGDGGVVFELDVGNREVTTWPVAPGANRMHAVALAPGNQSFATAGDDGVVRLWDRARREETTVLDPDRLYARFDITGAKLSDAQRRSLLDLGAVDDELSAREPERDTVAHGENVPPPQDEDVRPFSQIFLTFNYTGVRMRDQITVKGPVGVLGANAKIEHLVQFWNDNSEKIDLGQLATELAKLRDALGTPGDADRVAALGDLANAELSAKQGNGPEAIESLHRVGRLTGAAQWILDAGREVGAGLVVAVLKGVLGLP